MIKKNLKQAEAQKQHDFLSETSVYPFLHYILSKIICIMKILNFMSKPSGSYIVKTKILDCSRDWAHSESTKSTLVFYSRYELTTRIHRRLRMIELMSPIINHNRYEGSGQK